MSFSQRKKKVQRIIDELAEEYKQASYWLPFDALEIKKTFTKKELAQLEKFVDEMDRARSNTARKANIIKNASDYAGMLVKVLRLAKVIG